MPNPDLYAFLTQQQAMEKQQKAAGGPAPSYAEEYGLAGAYTTGLEQEARLSQQHGEFEESLAFAEKQRQTQSLTSAASGAVSVPLAAMQGYNLYQRGQLASAQTAKLAATPGTTPPSTGAPAGETPPTFSSTSPTDMGGVEQSMPATGTDLAATAAPAADEGFFSGVTGTSVGGAGLTGSLAGGYAPLPSKAVPFGGTREKKVIGGAVAGAGAGALTGALTGASASLWSGPGAIIGTIVGAVAGGLAAYLKSGKKSVICTELQRQGLVSPEILRKVHSYQWDWETYWGYRTWADKVVKGMQKSRFLTRLVLLIAKPYMKEILHRLDPNQLGSFCGVLLIQLGVPLCKQIFRFNIRRYRKALAWQQDCFKKVGE
jgi:hypothetical protein